MKRTYLLFVTILLGINFSMAQDDSTCACCTEQHKAFDFWLGDWTVYNSKGDIVGHNNLVKMQDECVMQENWVAANGTNTGTSYNFYDQKDSTWNQVWISNTGNILILKGNLNSNGEMVLKSELIEGKKGNYYNQITWFEDEKKNVIQRWDILSEEGETIKTVFEGIYKKDK
ncbi:MAG: hypothetical protein R3277_03190 [Brumimicrobium sp.]|nr:hypothetical protein [Brumimicrobium sp.]